MKRRLTPLLAITIALTLFSGLAYAVEKKKKAKPVDRAPEEMSEEALKVELLDATEKHLKNKPGIDDASSKKIVDSRTDLQKGQLQSK
jgi:hypothetical protein